ncbi:cation diffusion facilitator family transporter [Chengkuizengella marina]|uniref:Cation transporter n=1 Tax=Chengkuizengella marina TaxID=2507566 RepID=A0A6N9Q0C6_9BACL|nr:cation diffusion facilitator family transporter [Chengkuizengella marina]NBI28355.1 cation transporter [Chengkuizengella marina]
MHTHQNHTHNHSNHQHTSNNKKGLSIALIITSTIMLLEFFGGLITNSLALLSDSGHMLSDAASLALSLAAMWIATKPVRSSKTYGFHRFEILAALFNGVTLFIIAGFIIYEAYGRFWEPPTVASGSMMIIATIGLLANIMSAWVLMRKGDVKENINVRSAYLHIIGDAMGSVGAIVAGFIMLVFGWYVADPIISVIVAILILKSAWGIIKHAIHILMEGTPTTIEYDKVNNTLMKLEGVKNVHDLHIWTITSNFHALTCHVVVEDAKNEQELLQEAIELLEKEFNIDHVTIQVEKSNTHHSELKV